MSGIHDQLRTRRYEALRSILKRERKRLGLTQTDVANRIGRPQTYVSDIETGVRRVDVVEFLRLAKALKIDPAKTITEINRVPDRR